LHSCQLPKGRHQQQDWQQITLAAPFCLLLEELERCIASTDMPDYQLIITAELKRHTPP
jgi:hypothetical protein